MNSTRRPIAPWDRLMAIGLPDGHQAQSLILRRMGFKIGQIARLTGNSRRAVRRFLYEARRSALTATQPHHHRPEESLPVFEQLLRRAILALERPSVIFTDQACALPRQLVSSFLTDNSATSTDAAAPCPHHGADPVVR